MASTDSICKVAEWSGPLICPFFDEAAHMNLGAVVIGGLIGGALQPLYEQLSDDHRNPTRWDYLRNGLLGVAAAGIAVYVAIPHDHSNVVRILFFAMLCGLAFPSVLTSAIGGLNRKTQQVQQNVAQIAQDAQDNNIRKTVQVAEQLRTELGNNPARDIGASGVPVVEASAQTAVRNIAQTAKVDLQSAAEVIGQLQEVAAVAQTAGYKDTVQAAAEQLSKLSTLQIAPELQALADGAAKRFAS